MAVSGSLLAVALFVPVLLSLVGGHAGDTVCTMAASFEKPLPVKRQVIQKAPGLPYSLQEPMASAEWTFDN